MIFVLAKWGIGFYTLYYSIINPEIGLKAFVIGFILGMVWMKTIFNMVLDFWLNPPDPKLLWILRKINDNANLTTVSILNRNRIYDVYKRNKWW